MSERVIAWTLVGVFLLMIANVLLLAFQVTQGGAL